MSQTEHETPADPRRDVLAALTQQVPYLSHMGFTFSPNASGDGLEGIMPFRCDLIGNPTIPALHGGVIASFLEMSALVNLGWATLWEEGVLSPDASGCTLPAIPKTIDLTVDYMRSGKPQDCYSSARISRAGRRYATVHVDVWQDEPERPIAQAMCHFLMPPAAATSSTPWRKDAQSAAGARGK